MDVWLQLRNNMTNLGKKITTMNIYIFLTEANKAYVSLILGKQCIKRRNILQLPCLSFSIGFVWRSYSPLFRRSSCPCSVPLAWLCTESNALQSRNISFISRWNQIKSIHLQQYITQLLWEMPSSIKKKISCRKLYGGRTLVKHLLCLRYRNAQSITCIKSVDW